MSVSEKNENTEIVVKAEDTYHDIGIVGLWFGLNYGSILTYYALYDVVTKMGYSAIMVNKPEVLWRPKYADKSSVANRFIYKYCDNNVTQCYHSSLDYKVLNKTVDTFIVGSDVVWHYAICGKDAGQFFFLDFVNDDKKKIAMASSFGAGYDGPDEARVWSEHYMKKFDYIGVREDDAVNICRDIFHSHADKIMDPVFLCDRQVYHDLANKSKVHEDEKYISSYFLGPGKEKADMFLKIADILGCGYRCLPNPNNPENFTKKTGLPAIQDPDVEDWLKYFQNTQCYVGDSFHGLCFSIIFGRPFVCIVNQGQSLARFKTLLATVGLENRMINIDEEDISEEAIDKRLREILAQEIDYEKVWAIIDEKSKSSYDWLKNAIESEKKISEEQLKESLKLRNPKMDGINPINVSGVPDTVCTGCSACMNVCPADAITMQDNDEGFIMPSVNNDKCVKCKKCILTCPAVNTLLDNVRQPDVYSAVAKDDIRDASSSGGMFTVAAEKVLESGGYVCGAVFDYDNLELLHKITDNKDDLGTMRKAKYSQSNINYLYRDIKKLLKDNKTVLFTGTPCQVSGLKAYLGKDYENLYLIDILCRGVPSQKFLKDYVEEISQLPEISLGEEPPKPVEIIFRDKDRHGWQCSTFIRIVFDNGTEYEGSLLGEDVFEKAFHENLALRKSCGDCIFCAFPRQGDISIGDFWGIMNISPEAYDKKGTSMVLVNNAHGRQLFDSLTPELSKSKFVKINPSEIKLNRLKAKVPVNQGRERFFDLLKHHGVNESVSLVSKNHFDVGLAVNFYAINFGGALTHYALYHTIEDLGYSTLMIERPRTSKNLVKVMENSPKIHLEPLYPSYAISKSYQDRDDMRKFLNPRCDMFVVGSDKLFNYVLYTALDKYTSLDWVSDTKKKIAYSASFGRTLGSPKIHSELGYFLQKFDHFSCREDSGVDTAKEVYGVKDPTWVLDPVFLCDMKHYQALIDRCKRKTPEKYVSAYILDPTEKKADIVRTFRDSLGADCESFSEYLRGKKYYAPLGELYKKPLKTEERLQSIANCDFFVTDSFHGMCFAILMKKPFAAIINEKRGASRFYSIARMLHLEDRLITDQDNFDKEKLLQPIDYDKVYEVLNKERERCMNWLKNALAAPKVSAMSDYDIMYELLKEQDNKLENMRDLIMNMVSNVSTSISDKTDIMDYLEVLKSQFRGNIIVVSVKDTPGLALNSFVVNKLTSLGLKENLEGKHGHSYVAVINGGKVIFEKLGENEEPTVYDGNVGKNSLHVVSRVYNNGNEASIQINGKEYAVNSRGLNIVIYNKTTMKPVDSVCFDTHISDFTCQR